MNIVESLQSIGLRHGTDKTDKHHSFNGRSYLDVYERYFSHIRESAKVVVELGVLHGRSLKTWRDWFVNAEIWGVDLNPGARQDYGPRTHVVIGPQDDPKTLAAVSPSMMIDVVVDDASHLVEPIIGSFKLLWPFIAPGGFYCIEDTCFSYLDVSSSNGTWPGQDLNPPGTNYVNDRNKLNTVLLHLIHRIDTQQGDAFGIHFHSNQILIQKTL